MRAALIGVVLFSGFFVSCSDSGVEPSDLDDIATVDSTGSDTSSPDVGDTGAPEDANTDDDDGTTDAEDTEPDSEIDAGPEDSGPEDGGPEDGGPDDTATSDTAPDSEADATGSDLGDPCVSNGECASRACLRGESGGYCSVACDEASDCAEDWACRITSVDPLEQRCVRGPEPACFDCERDSDCTAVDYRCAALSDGDFCLAPCTDDVDCDAGYSCGVAMVAGLPEGEREPMRRCVPAAGACGLCADGDGDGFGLGSACLDIDCIDDDALSNPRADERCDGVDNTCEGDIDEGFDLESDDENCGACGVQCSANNGAAVCIDAACVVEDCTPGFGDCNNEGGDGCETRLDTVDDCLGCGTRCSAVNGTATCGVVGCEVASCDDAFGDCNDFYRDGCESSLRQVDNCGVCGNVCDFPNATPSCSGEGACLLRACVSGFYDLDEGSENGCEYACEGDPSFEDVPDDAFEDSNCDGVDGDLSDAVFLSTAGSPDNSGLLASAPVSSIEDALATAQASGRSQILIATGDYDVSRFELIAGVSLYGGYDDAFTMRTTRRPSFVSNRSPVIWATGLNAPTTLDSLSIETGEQTLPGAPSIVMWVRDSGTALTLRRVSLNAGLGAPGLNGISRTQEDPAAAGSRALGNRGGAAGAGNAGRGGSGAEQDLGGDGNDASRVGPSCGGGGEGGRSDSCRVTGDQSGADGDDGCAAAAGAHGAGGESLGSYADGIYLAVNGENGQDGTAGGGGGGGGAGGGADCEICTPTCNCVNCGTGRGGGGGGAGGAAGRAGSGGQTAGSSIGLILDASTPQLFAVTIRPFVGGDGGRGANAALGQPGGEGGPGANATNASQGDGGDGGDGADGGNGGCGGGGAGGSAIAILGVGDEQFISLGENRFPLGVSGRVGSACSDFDGERGGAGIAVEFFNVTEVTP